MRDQVLSIVDYKRLPYDVRRQVLDTSTSRRGKAYKARPSSCKGIGAAALNVLPEYEYVPLLHKQPLVLA